MKTLMLALLLCAGPAWAGEEFMLIETIEPCYEKINGKWVSVECNKYVGMSSDGAFSHMDNNAKWKMVSIDEFSCLFRMKQAMKDADAILSPVAEYEPSYDGCNTCDLAGCTLLHCTNDTTVARLEWELQQAKKKKAAEVHKREVVKQWRDVMKECVQY